MENSVKNTNIVREMLLIEENRKIDDGVLFKKS